MTPKQLVSEIFARWQQGDSKPFFEALSPNVVWTAIGTTPISGTVKSKQAYMDEIYKPLLSVFSGPTRCEVRRIVAEGDTVVVEWHGETPTHAGPVYSNDYCWLFRVSPDVTTILEVTGYFDTARVNELLAPPKRP